MATDTEPNDTPLERSKPPFLRRVRIRGYKSIAFCDVTLEPLTVLVGRNASGKSNFLDALGFLRDVVGRGLHEAVKQHGGVDEIPCRLGNDRITSIELQSGYQISRDPTPWVATYRIDILFPPKRPAAIGREELWIEQGNWGVGYTTH